MFLPPCFKFWRLPVALAGLWVLLVTGPASTLAAPEWPQPHGGQTIPIPMAMLGDSDTQGYQDRIWLPQGRGGSFATHTLQWTEVLAQLRADALDLGRREVWGHRQTLARLLDSMGADLRTPRKLDHRNNFAFSGAGCDQLMSGINRQAPRLVAMMDTEADRWRQGVVVIRIGVVSFGYADTLGQLAKDPMTPVAQAKMATCVAQIRLAVDLIHRSHPQTRIVLVGIFNNADYPPYLAFWPTVAELANINAGLDAFDEALRQLAAQDPRIAFFDDRRWFDHLWGSRASTGQPAYKTLHLGHGLDLTMTQGDEPTHATLADGHNGLVWNALWAQSMVELLRSAFGMPIAPITDAELTAFLARTLHAPHP